MIRSLFLMCLTTSLLTPAWGYIPNQTDKTIEQTEGSIQKNKQTIQTLSLNIKKRKKQEKVFQQALEKIDKNIHQVSKDLYQLRADIKEQKNLLSNLLEQQQILQKDAHFKQKKLNKLVQVANTLNKENKLKIMLSQSDPWLMDRLLFQHGQIQKVILKHLQDLREKMEAISALKNTSIETQEQLSKKETEQQQYLKKLAGLKLSQKTKKNALIALLKKDEESLSSIQVDQKALLKKLNDLKTAQLNQQSTFKKAKGDIQWPLALKDKRKIYKQWRQQTRSMDQYLIEAPEGEPVFAIFPGKIIFSNWLRGFGLLTIVDHGDGYMSLYGHNQTLLKQTGEWVKAGETIALVGQSGGVGKGGLYFEIRKDGQPLNLAKWYR